MTKQNPRHVHATLDIHVTAGAKCSGMITSNLDLAEALDYAHLLLANDAARLEVSIDYHEQCALCADSGRVRKPRARIAYATMKCPECQGLGHTHSETWVVVTR
jgi:hypothetical protein